MTVYLKPVSLTHLLFLGLPLACSLAACSPEATTIAEIYPDGSRNLDYRREVDDLEHQ
jgi:hypothetical protein